MANGTDSSETRGSISFDLEARLARRLDRRRFWHSIWWAGIALLVGGLFFTVIFNALYRLAVARTLHWPDSLPTPIAIFQESDPLLSLFLHKEGCVSAANGDSMEVSVGVECALLASAVQGDLAGINKLLVHVNNEFSAHSSLHDFKEALVHQMLDATDRRDWASCSAASWIALKLLDAEDSLPQETGRNGNQLLLLASACERPNDILRNEAPYVLLMQRIGKGTHLDLEFVAELQSRAVEDPLHAWGQYLSGLRALRIQDFNKANVLFDNSASLARNGTLHELALLASARSVFWSHKVLLRQQESGASSDSQETVTKLLQLGRSMQRVSFRNDVKHYLQELNQ